jgi:hypothetical protein
MTFRMMTLARAVTASVVLLAISGARATSQTPARKTGVPSPTDLARRVPVTVAIMDSPRGAAAPALIYRRAHLVPHDVIVLPRARATGDLLSAAMEALLVARDQQGDTSSSDGVIRVNRTTKPAFWRDRDTKLNRALVARLLKSEMWHQVPGIGDAPTEDLYLLPKAFHGKLTQTAP